MAQTPRLALPYPDENQDPFYDSFTAFAESVDQSLFAAQEDRNIIFSGGGTLTFDSGASTLTWSADFQFTAAETGFSWSVSAGTLAGISDGKLVAVTLVRNPTSNVVCTMATYDSIPINNDKLVIGVRRGTTFVFRTGAVVYNGSPRTLTNSSDTAANVGTGTGLVYNNKVGAEFQFNKIKEGTGIDVTTFGSDVVITGTDTASNLGTGEGVFSDKLGSDFRFKKIKAGTNVSLSSSATEITVTASKIGYPTEKMYSYIPMALNVTTTSVTDVQIGVFSLNTSDYYLTGTTTTYNFKFAADMPANPQTGTLTFREDPANDTAIAISDTSLGTAAVPLEMGYGTKIYRVFLKSGNAAWTAQCYWAGIEIVHTVT